MARSRALLAIAAAVVVGGPFARTAAAQGAVPRIWTGIYTVAQAERGKAVFQDTCTTCHNFDLKGNTNRGPALVGDPFMTNWETESLSALFARLKTTMPRNNPGTLTEGTYIDLLAYILQANAYPNGAAELSPAGLASVYILQKDGTGSKGVPNFAMVAMVGCLGRMDDHWVLTRASGPVMTEERAPTDRELQDARIQAPGDGTVRLVSVAGFKPDTHNGHRVQAKGLVYRVGNDNRLNLTGLHSLGSSCPN